jgi:hypothetical protein
MDSIEVEIIRALTLAGEPEHPTVDVAPWMAQAIRTLPIEDFKIHYVRHSGLISPEYTFGPTKHSIDNASSSEITIEGIEGTFLTRGRLLRFAHATWFGECRFPQIWHHDPKFRTNLALPSSHLATIEEVIWLGGFWHTSIDYDTIVNGHKMLGKTKDIDWRFRCRVNRIAKWINLEAKRRDADIRVLLPGGKPPLNPFADIPQKFSLSSNDEINVAAITIYGTDGEGMVIRTKSWLDQNRNVDCVLIWNDVTATVTPVAVDAKQEKLEWLLGFLDAPLPSGWVPSLIRHPIELPIIQ